MRTNGHGLTWVLPHARGVVVKSLAPDFVFVDADAFLETNVVDRLYKRSIEAYVSIDGPLSLLVREKGWEAFLQAPTEDLDRALLGYTKRVMETVDRVVEKGADAIVIVEDDVLPLLQPGTEVCHEQLRSIYAGISQQLIEVDIPLIFYAPGDIAQMYSELEAIGFDGVHVVHPDRTVVEELFAQARDFGLVPVGGIIMSKANASIQEHVSFATRLSETGPALICDDGQCENAEDFSKVTEIISQARKRL